MVGELNHACEATKRTSSGRRGPRKLSHVLKLWKMATWLNLLGKARREVMGPN